MVAVLLTPDFQALPSDSPHMAHCTRSASRIASAEAVTHGQLCSRQRDRPLWHSDDMIAAVEGRRSTVLGVYFYLFNNTLRLCADIINSVAT